jgi:lysophospholipase L1-like esterase
VFNRSPQRRHWRFSAAATAALTLGVLLFYRDWAGVEDKVSWIWQTLGQGSASSAPVPPQVAPVPEPELGPRVQLNYDQWVDQLHREAQVVATDRPARLAILAGDSLSLWFPAEQLPAGVTWLNQGISGETSGGLLRRLDIFDPTQPQVIFVMVGVNDLIRGYGRATVVANQQEIVRHLKQVHPKAKIVVQSILPHGDRAIILHQRDGRPAPEWAEALLAIANNNIRDLNDRLAAMAQAEGVEFLNLTPDFTTDDGHLHPDLTTDGLHLSPQGYAVWQKRLMTYLPAPA